MSIEKKHIIISGKMATGKTHIAEAIALTHKESSVLRIDSKNLIKKLHKGKEYKVFKNINLAIIEECSLTDIVFTKQSLTSDFDLTAVFLTLNSVPNDFKEDFHIINPNNYHL